MVPTRQTGLQNEGSETAHENGMHSGQVHEAACSVPSQHSRVDGGGLHDHARAANERIVGGSGLYRDAQVQIAKYGGRRPEQRGRALGDGYEMGADPGTAGGGTAGCGVGPEIRSAGEKGRGTLGSDGRWGDETTRGRAMARTTGTVAHGNGMGRRPSSRLGYAGAGTCTATSGERNAHAAETDAGDEALCGTAHTTNRGGTSNRQKAQSIYRKHDG